MTNDFLKKLSDDDFIEQLMNDLKRQHEFSERWANRLWDKRTAAERKELVLKLKQKYESSEYTKRYYSVGVEPPTDLFWTLYDYAKIHNYRNYADEVNEMFTTALFVIDGIVLERLDGQGSVCQIYESVDEYNRVKKKLHDKYYPDEEFNLLVV